MPSLPWRVARLDARSIHRLLSAVLASAVLAGCGAPPRRGGCPSESAAAEVDEVRRDLEGSRWISDPASAPAELPVVNLHVHVITAGSDGEIDEGTLVRQLDILDDAFASTGWAFEQVTLDVTDAPQWYHADWGDPAERAMKEALRRGGVGDLNVYFTEPPGDWTGWSTFPWQYQRDPLYDGVVLDNTVLLEGGGAPWDEGDQLVHEVGHWMGLWHPFQGGCRGGDAVDDTPAEDRAAWGCHPDRDSCRAAGTDPVRNYMDYSDDDCIDEFTSGQADRVRWALRRYRELRP